MNNDIAQAMGGAAFVPANEDTTDIFAPIPVGWYPCQIEKAEIRNTNDGQGIYVWMQLVVVGEKFAGRKVFTKIHLVNSSDACVNRSKRELGQLSIACNVSELKSTDQIVGKIVSVKLKIEKSEGYDPQNDVDGYKSISAQSVPAPAPVATAVSAPAPTAGVMPWEAK